MRLIVPLTPGTEDEAATSWGLSLGYALRIGMRHLYMLDGSELDFALEGPWSRRDGEESLSYLSLSFIDPSIGGTGYLSKIAGEFHLVASHALQHLEHEGCETACYRCLKSYANQRYHDLLRWPLAVPGLEAISAAAPEKVAAELGDISDPKPWLEAFAAGVGSPLELKFLRLFEAHGFTPQKQVPISVVEGTPPITLADFAVPERRLAIYVDGASVHTGRNLRRDRKIRERLSGSSPPWRVVALRALDLARGAALVAELLIRP